MSIDYVNKLVILMWLVVSCIVQMTLTYLSWFDTPRSKDTGILLSP